MPPNRPERIFRLAALIVATVLLFARTLPASESTASSADAMRLLKKNCLSCHNEEKRKGGLAITSREALLEGGDSGSALVEGKAEESLLITSLAAGADPHMPPKKQLPKSQIEFLAQWVKDGAQWDAAALAGPTSIPRPVSLAPLPVSYQPVLTLALSPDAKRLAVGCGNEVLIYELSKDSLNLVTRASAHPDPVQSLAWSPDGKRLATGAFRRVVLWNAEALAADRVITTGLTDRIAKLQFHPDGKRVVIADGVIAEEGTVRIIDVESGSIATSWSAHEDTIFDLALSADGKLLATAGGDKMVKIWDLETQKEQARLEGHAAQVLTVGFNTDATQLVTGGADQQLKLWDVKTKEQTGTLGRHSSAINAITWISTTPTVLAITDAGALLRYTELKAHSGAQSSQTATERRLSATDETLYCLAATPDGERIFAGSYDGQLFTWNKDGKLLSTLKIHETKATASVAP